MIDKLTPLHRLPVLPTYEDTILQSYLNERDAIRSQKELRSFVHRWRYMWRLPVMGLNRGVQREDFDLGRGIVHKRVFKHFIEIRGNKDHIPPESPGRMWTTACSLVLPLALLLASSVERTYMVPHDIAMQQLYGRGYSW